MRNPGRHSKLLRRGALAVVSGALALQGCGETLTQVSEGDVAELRASADSVSVAVGWDVQLRAYPLDATGALLVGQSVAWRSLDATVASVDDVGLVTGEAEGTTRVVASLGAFADTTVVAVALPPALTLSEDSVGFEAVAGGSDPAPQAIDVTNTGGFPLVGLAVDSIVYGAGANDWLSAVAAQPTAPTTVDLTAGTAGVTTAGTYRASVWLSATDADGSPAEIVVTLSITAGAAASLAIHDGDDQIAVAGSAVGLAPSVLLRDAFDNPVPGASVAFAVTGGGGSVGGAPATSNASGVARVGSWTLGTVAGDNELTATFGALTPVAFVATGIAGPAAQVVVSAGDNQSAVAGSAVTTPPSVTVQDVNGNGVADVAVTFTVTSGGGDITGGSQTSDADGIATVGSWTLGTTAGTNTLDASASGVATPATITATGLSGTASAVVLQAGQAQSDTVAATLATAYAVRVVDSNDNGVQGVPVTWTVTGGGGTIGGSGTAVAIPTDADGLSTAVRVLGTVPGTHTASAGVGGLNVVDFSATASVGSPHQILIHAGNAQTDTVRAILAVDPTVRVTDRFNNPIAGHSVTFAVTASNGIVVPTAAITTQANGTAAVTSWQLGTAAGSGNNQLRATASGPGIAGQFVTFTASATAGNPASIAIVQGNGQTAITGTNVAITPTVVVRDQLLNPVPGRTVNFTITNGSIGSPSPTTNASGQAATSWAPSVVGGVMQTNGTFPDLLTATVSGTAISTQFTASAIYSYVTHVNGMWSATGCTGCHSGTSGGFSGLSLGGTASQNRTMLVTNAAPTCDATLTSYRRVRTDGGTNAHSFSILRIFMEPAGSDAVGACGPHSTKVSAANLNIIRAWIRNGAPNN